MAASESDLWVEAVRGAVAANHARWVAIMTSAEAEKRFPVAVQIAMRSTLNAPDAIALLAKLPECNANTDKSTAQEARPRPALRVIHGTGLKRKVRCKDCRHFGKGGCGKGIKIKSWTAWRYCPEHSDYREREHA